MASALRNTLCIFFFLLLIASKCFAGIDPYQNFIKGQLKINDTLVVKDEKFKNPLFNWADISNISVQNSITLRVIDEVVISRDFSCTVTVKVEYFSDPGQTVPTLIESLALKVNYSKKGGTVYKPIDTKEFTNGYYVKVTITDINSPEFGTELPPVLQLSSNILIDRKYLFKPSLFIGINGQPRNEHGNMSLPDTGGPNDKNQLYLSWSATPGAEEYDLEWVTIDEDSEWWTLANQLQSNASMLVNAQVNEIFRNNATRITTHENSYLISLLYNSGLMAVRIRQVQYDADGIRLEGDWLYKKENNTDLAIWPLSWHEDSLNWQYSVTYAEEGKKKEVVSYLDGTLRNRQTVTLSNTENIAVVQESVYDKFGRAAASILPAPVKETNLSSQYLHYFKSFNRDTLGNNYRISNLDSGICEPSTKPLSTASGASMYYSSQNQFMGDKLYNKYIPDAQRYPISVTQYTADNTGRIKIQGGVGATFQPNNGSFSHTTKYFYGKPEQWELDRIFGNDVGYAEHYLKNMVVDPNGQISISYLNAGGKTIATALTGKTPENLDSLSSNPIEKRQTVTLLKPDQFRFNSSSLKLTATTTYMAAVTGRDTLSYDIEKLISRYPGGDFQPCSNCYYDLNITVTDNCGFKVYVDSMPIKIGSDTSNINDTGLHTGRFPLEINQIGEYYVTFDFALSRDVIAHFTTEFVKQGQANGKLKQKTEFILNHLKDLRFEDGFSDCKTAVSKLGTKTAFTAAFNSKMESLGDTTTFFDAYVSGLYDRLLLTATTLQASCAVVSSPCDIYRAPMLTDVSPGGQYAMVDSLGNLTELSTNVLSLYLHHGAFDPLPMQSPVYQANLIIKEDGSGTTSPYDANFTTADLIKYWKAEWAEQFLPFHPEFCKLEFCIQNAASANWDEKVREINAITDIPTVIPGAEFSRTNLDWLIAKDPFFQVNGKGYKYLADIKADFVSYTIRILKLTSLSTKNISEFIDFQLYCSDTTATTNQTDNANRWLNCSPKADCRVPDREWQSYRDMYLDLKRFYFQKLRAEHCLSANACPVGTAIKMPTFGSPVAPCNYDGPTADSDKAVAMQQLSTILSSNANSAIEMWLYSGNYGGRQFIAATPDKKYMLQTCINGSLLGVDIFSLQQSTPDNISIVLSKHYTVNIGDMLPLTPWVHLALQLKPNDLEIWVNGKKYPLLLNAPPAGCSWEITTNPLKLPENFGRLHHLRLYSGRNMSNAEIVANAASKCFLAADHTAMTWYRFNTAMPTIPIPEPDCASLNLPYGAEQTGLSQFRYTDYATNIRQTYTFVAGSEGIAPNTALYCNSPGTSTTIFRHCIDVLDVSFGEETLRFQNVWQITCTEPIPATPGCATLQIPGYAEQLAENQFRYDDYNVSIRKATYTFVPGVANTQPNTVPYETAQGLINTIYRPCIDVAWGTTTIRFENVWEIINEEPSNGTCNNADGFLYPDRQGLGRFYKNETGYNRDEYTIYEGYSAASPPNVSCEQGADSGIQFFSCFVVYINAGAIYYHNVWVGACYGVQYGPRPRNQRMVSNAKITSALVDAVEVNTTGGHAEAIRLTKELKENKAANELILGNCRNLNVYSIILNPGGVENVNEEPPVKSSFNPYVLKAHFSVESAKGYFSIFKNVYVAALIQEEGSEKDKPKNAAVPNASRSASTNAIESSGSPISTVVCAQLVDEYIGESSTLCGDDVYDNILHRTTLKLVDGNGNPVIATHNVSVDLQYAIIREDQNGNPYQLVPITISIPVGSSSALYEYYSIGYNREPPGICVAQQEILNCIVGINGASFCTQITTCDGTILYPPTAPGPDCPAILLSKISRFPEVDITTTGQVDTTALNNEATALLKKQIATAVSGMSDIWIMRLQPGLRAAGYTLEVTEFLRAMLIELSVTAGDLEHPMGASSLPAGKSILVNGVACRNFGDVIKQVLHINKFTEGLNPWLLDAPYPYNVTQQSNPITIANSSLALCAKLNVLNTGNWNAADFYTQLSNTYGAAMTLSQSDLEVLMKGCGNCKYILSRDIELPLFMQPGQKGCISRNEYLTLKQGFNVAFNTQPDTTWNNYEVILANYINHKLGFALSYVQYNDFENSSDTQLCNVPPYTTLEEDPYASLKGLVELAHGAGSRDYEAYLTAEKEKFRSAYINTCAAAKVNADLHTKHKTYHYTLYYYDQAGNLVRTVPPEGVAFLDDAEMDRVKVVRAHSDDVNCYNGPATAATPQAALFHLSRILKDSVGHAVEMWFYNDLKGSPQFISATQDMKSAMQVCQNGKWLTVNVYSLEQTATDTVKVILTNKITADVSGSLVLAPWTHLVLQGNDLSRGSLQLYINGKLATALTNAPATPCVLPTINNPLNIPQDFSGLKHLRLYTGRLMGAQEIETNAASNCFMASDTTKMRWYRFNLPLPGSSTTIAENTTQEAQYYPIYPDHALPTTYTYNATNQVVKQRTPDAGISKFWYDYRSRLVTSQNAKQALERNFSYTKYDVLGRIIEVGQKRVSNSGLTDPDYLSDATYLSFLNLGANTQMTKTFYDNVPALTPAGLTFNNQRNRVAATLVTSSSSFYDNASYYSYDLNGNVSTLYQDLDAILGVKKISYEYDLISGKVNFLAYQHGANDQFYYQYKYDAENRLTEAWSATKAKVVSYGIGSSLHDPYSRLDAKYQYYLHGPLARMELGSEYRKVQGTDYAYTLQGWLKGVNGTQLAGQVADIGVDGNVVAQDALAYSLGYYDGDYKAIGGSTAQALNQPYKAALGDITGLSLYNGNISSSTYAIGKIDTTGAVGYTYRYDQLNRLKNMRQHVLPGSGVWTSSSLTNNYREDFNYDGNGNILSLSRNSKGNSPMDKLIYQYNADSKGKLANNQLASLSDEVTASNQTGEFKGTNSYSYDAIGNLSQEYDDSPRIISWNVYGKIVQVTRGSSITGYQYDATGNRVRKVSIIGQDIDRTYYIRDGQGNSLATYKREGDAPDYKITWKEQHLYGSSRIGLWRPDIDLATATGSSRWDSIGKKSYELNNHLGNVMAVISDHRLQVDGGYKADVLSAQDYYTFGSLMPGRGFDSSKYRYGFNGKENDNEIKGDGNQQDYGMRIYDPRIGKFLSVDPITSQYPSLTPYQFASNSPIANVDLDGLEADLAIYGRGGEGTAYTSQDILAFKARANDMRKMGFNSVSAHNGQTLVDQLKLATKTEGSVSSIISFAHGGANGMFLDNDAGFYTSNYNRSSQGSDLSTLSKVVESGDVKFTKNATWIFASCNAGNADDPVWKAGNLNLARNAAKSLNIQTIGARGYVSPEIVNGKETGRLIAGNAHGTDIDDVGFIKFTPVVIKVKMRSLADVLFGRPGKDVEIRTGEIKEEKLGLIINPTDFVPKK